MRINYNTTAHLALNSVNANDTNLSKSLQKLSSGLQIVNARENPAGLAMAKRMNMQIEGLSVANDDASDGMSIAETADGALSEVHDMLQRINELAVKANNGTLTPEDRETIQKEIAQLKVEITRIAKDTEFNGEKLLDGTWDLKGYSDSDTVKVAGYSDDVTVGNYTLPVFSASFDGDGNILDVKAYTDATKTTECLIGPDADGKYTQDLSMGGNLPSGSQITKTDGNRITISDGKGFELKLDITAPAGGGAKDVVTTDEYGNQSNTVVELNGLGAMTIQTGANEHQILDMRIPEISLKNIGIEKIDVSTPEGAYDALDRMGDAIAFISEVRSRIGAYQNRLEHTVSNLDITSENMTAAYSRIMDVDMAEEMTNYTSQQVLTQAATSMLAQANQRPSEVLQLLQ